MRSGLVSQGFPHIADGARFRASKTKDGTYLRLLFSPAIAQGPCSVLPCLQPLTPMNASNSTILLGLPVKTVAEIAENADSLQSIAHSLPDGRFAGHLALHRGRVVPGTEGAFTSKEHAVTHLHDLVTACVDWGNTHRPARMADASFTC